MSEGSVTLRWHEALAARDRLTGAARLFVLAACLTSIAGIAVIDYLTDVRVSLAVFYLIPTVIGALLVGPLAGGVLAVASSIAWVSADALINGRTDSRFVLFGNGVLRLLPLLVVVVLLADLRRVLEHTRRSERSTQEFLAFAAHQLRTPIAGVQATTEALLLADSTPEHQADRERLLVNLAGESSRMGRLVHSLLRVTRLDQGEPTARRPADVRAICAEEVARFEHATTVEVVLEVAERVPPVLELDANDIAEIVANLLDNARRHARERVEVRIDVVPDHRPGAVVVQVRDDGPGLPSGTEELVFERFVSLDRCGGSGLGLSIARSLAAKNRGTLRYVDGTFVLMLPV
jgi:signal transduction histidine kinase